jgi:hypothetical protein
LLIVNVLHIDFLAHPEGRAAIVDVVRRSRTGIDHWGRNR